MRRGNGGCAVYLRWNDTREVFVVEFKGERGESFLVMNERVPTIHHVCSAPLIAKLILTEKMVRGRLTCRLCTSARIFVDQAQYQWPKYHPGYPSH